MRATLSSISKLMLASVAALFAAVTLAHVHASDGGSPYDANGDDIIDRSEAIAAIVDYFAEKIDKPTVIGVINAYFNPPPVPPPPRLGCSEMLPRIHLGIGMNGCRTEHAVIYLADSIPPMRAAEIDQVIIAVNEALEADLGIDATALEAPTVYLVRERSELDAVKEHLGNSPAGADGWFDCCGDDAGVYGNMSGSNLKNIVAHEYTHHALYHHYGYG